jgi:hypothetical protein
VNGGKRKKEQMRKNEEERVDDLCITQWVPASIVPLVNHRAPGGLVPLLVGPRAQHKGALQLYKGIYCVMGAGGFGWQGGHNYHWHPAITLGCQG